MHPRFDTEARIAVAQAADIARELAHTEVGPDHLLLGLLANPRGTAYAALTDHGLRLDAAREIVAAQHVDHVPDHQQDPETDRPAEQTSYDDDREALRAIGIDLDRVRDAVRDNLGQDLAEGWATVPTAATGAVAGRPRPRPRGARRGSPRTRTPPRALPPRGPRPTWPPQPPRRRPAFLARAARSAARRTPLGPARPDRRLPATRGSRPVRCPAAAGADAVRRRGRDDRARRRDRPRRPAGLRGGGGHRRRRLTHRARRPPGPHPSGRSSTR